MNYKKKLYLLLLTALIIRIAFAIYAYNINIMQTFSDDKAYMNLAENMLIQGPFITDISKLDPSAKVVGPGIGWVMALIMFIFGKSWLPIFIINAIISTISCFLVYLIAERVFKNKLISLISLGWTTFYPLYIRFIPRGGKEIWMIFLFLLMIYIFFIQINNKKWLIKIFALSIIFILLIHIDERYVAYFPLIAFFIYFLERDNIKLKLKKSIIFSFLVILLLVPWTFRNYKVFGKIYILSKRTGMITNKLFGYEELPTFVTKWGGNRWYISKSQIDSIITYGKRVTMRHGKKISFQEVKTIQKGKIPHNFSRLEKYLSSFVNLWEPFDFNNGFYDTGYRFDDAWSIKHNLISIFFYGILLPFFIFSLLLLLKNNFKIGFFFLSVFLLHTLIHMLLIPFTIDRYRIPLDGLIIILGFWGMSKTFEYLKKNKTKAIL